MKYMIMMFGGVGGAVTGKSPEWITGFHELIMKLDTELRESGELVDSQKLMDPSRARTVRLVDGAPAPTDGPFAEVKESLAGYWVIEASEERAIEVTAQVVGYCGYPMEVRRIMDEPPQE
jgi:hypothetical protein